MDCETGGLDSSKNPITGIAAIVLSCVDYSELDRFETYVKPYNDLVVTQDALDRSMVKMADLEKGMEAKKLAILLSTMFKKHNPSKKDLSKPILVGHNTQFDHGFLKYLFANFLTTDADKKIGKIVDVNDFIMPNLIDTMLDSKRLWGNDKGKEDNNIKLTTCVKKAGLSVRDAHGAMEDVIMTRDLFFWFNNRLSTDGSAGVVQKIKKSREHFQF